MSTTSWTPSPPSPPATGSSTTTGTARRRPFWRSTTPWPPPTPTHSSPSPALITRRSPLHLGTAPDTPRVEHGSGNLIQLQLTARQNSVAGEGDPGLTPGITLRSSVAEAELVRAMEAALAGRRDLE